MASTSAAIEVPVSASQVWQLIGGFNSLPDWLPFVRHSELSEGGRAIARNVKDNLTISGRRGRCLKILPAKQLSEIAIVHACLEATDFQPHLCLSILS
jgi:hypothetical protein